MSRQLRDEAWQRIRNGLDVRPSAKVLLLAIAEQCDGELRAKEETIAEWIGMSKRSVSRLLAELIEGGCLVQTARSARGHVPRFAVFPNNETLAKYGERNTRQHVANVEEDILYEHTPTPGEHTPTLSGTHANAGVQNQKEPEEPARTYEEAEYENWVRDRARVKGGGSGLERTIRREDRHIFEAERRKEIDQTNRHRAIAGCDRCDSLGFIDYDDGSLMGGRRKCTHPDLAEELTA